MSGRKNLLGALVVGAGLGMALGCQTYDFEPVEPLAVAQTTREESVKAVSQKPNMMLVVDKSGSMNGAAGSGTRLSELKKSMGDFLRDNGAIARMGLTVFPYATTNTDACTTGRQVLDIVQSNDVDAELNAAASAINTRIQALDQNATTPESKVTGGTPTAATLNLVANNPLLREAGRPNIVLLLTDGLPNCNEGNNLPCTSSDPSTTATSKLQCLDQTAAVQAVTALKSNGVSTIVVGFGADTSGATAKGVLNAMAEAGNYPRTCDQCAAGETCDPVSKLCPTRYYQAADAAALTVVLNEIIQLIKTNPCEWVLASKPMDQSHLAVYINGALVGSGGDTWTYDSSKVMVTFTGSLCTQVKSGTPQKPVNVAIKVITAL